MWKYIVILSLLLFCGCDLFQTREAEPPLDPPLWNNFFTTWQRTMENLVYAYEDSRNVVKYFDLFTEGYRFYFAAQDISDYNITQLWQRDQERDMLFNLSNWAEEMTLTLSEITDQPDQITTGEVYLYRTYQISILRSKITYQYSGKLELQIRLVSGYWRINRWNDYRDDSGHPSWGKLKYDFAQN